MFSSGCLSQMASHFILRKQEMKPHTFPFKLPNLMRHPFAAILFGRIANTPSYVLRVVESCQQFTLMFRGISRGYKRVMSGCADCSFLYINSSHKYTEFYNHQTEDFLINSESSRNCSQDLGFGSLYLGL